MYVLVWSYGIICLFEIVFVCFVCLLACMFVCFLFFYFSFTEIARLFQTEMVVQI